MRVVADPKDKWKHRTGVGAHLLYGHCRVVLFWEVGGTWRTHKKTVLTFILVRVVAVSELILEPPDGSGTTPMGTVVWIRFGRWGGGTGNLRINLG